MIVNHSNQIMQERVEEVLKIWEIENVSERLWNKDPFVWKDNSEEHNELADRLGWLDLPTQMKTSILELEIFVDEIKNKFTKVLVLGMGGSSLAPEVFYKTFGSREGFPTLEILDSTHPKIIKHFLENYDLQKTLFVVSSKSGGTVETNSFYLTFYNHLKKTKNNPGENFIAITDKNSSLEKIALENKFVKIFTTPSEVGGRYSAFTYFGMVPAALIGIDVKKFLSRAEQIEKNCEEKNLFANSGFLLGAILGEYEKIGRNKLTFFASPQISSFPAWVEQLIAESSGKEGKGILPVVDEKFIGKEFYGTDRIFVYLKLKSDNTYSLIFEELKEAEIPNIIIELNDLYDIAKEFYRWEFATAVAAIVSKINPFDQPDVQLAKSYATKALNDYKKSGSLPQFTPAIETENVNIYSDFPIMKLNEVWEQFFGDVKAGDYLSILAFTEYDKKIQEVLNKFRESIQKKYLIATTLGFGPRYLHSTGQLHKGGMNTGYFIQIIDEIDLDIDVPEQGYSFGLLISAQANGDYSALKDRNRKVIRVKIKKDLISSINKLFN